MRDYPKEDYEKKDLEDLNAKEWMMDALKMNPDYNCWGNGEDYMWTKEKSGWNSSVELESFDNAFSLDELNELVNFHFEVTRDSVRCEDCDGSGQNPETKQISDDWYDFEGTGRKWNSRITQDEVDALWDRNRLRGDFKQKPTAEEVNAWNRGGGMGHDAINQWICVETRAKRLGVYGNCEKCNGKGYIYTAPKAHLALQMWFLHPRKGASRGVYLKNIDKKDVNKVIAYLQEAAKRNADRFSRLQPVI